MRAKQKIVQDRGPSNINLDTVFVFAPLMFAGFHNHFPLYLWFKGLRSSPVTSVFDLMRLILGVCFTNIQNYKGTRKT